MRLPDPFTNADAPGFTGARLVDNNPVIYDEMPNGSVLRVDGAAQFWSLELTYPELFYMEFAVLSAAVMEAIRVGDTIDVLLPQYENYRVTGNPNSTVITAGQKGNQIVIQNASALNGRPNIGDLFKITGHSKVYKITSYTLNNASNSITLGLYPKLAKITDGTEKPIFNNILFEMVLVDDTIPTEDLDVNGMYQGFELTLRENVHAE
ncbi:distal tail protein [Vibrio phage vB_ValS_X1]|uniref:Distal tail protein n=1 Tax=Vibrio phage vB_ValS_X1 TaxID=2736341 RepID=A0A6M9Z858_9CAUD|nr:distal tail protein [Vibrio phage vB_ValS_X1]